MFPDVIVATQYLIPLREAGNTLTYMAQACAQAVLPTNAGGYE
jgi:hypothetical protein